MTPINLLLATTGEMQWLRLQTQSAKFGFKTFENIEDFVNIPDKSRWRYIETTVLQTGVGWRWRGATTCCRVEGSMLL